MLPLSLYQLQLPLASLSLFALSTLLLLRICHRPWQTVQCHQSGDYQWCLCMSYLPHYFLLLSNFRIFCFICFYPTLCSYLFLGRLLLPHILAEVASSCHSTQQPPFKHLFLNLRCAPIGFFMSTGTVAVASVVSFQLLAPSFFAYVAFSSFLVTELAMPCSFFRQLCLQHNKCSIVESNIFLSFSTIYYRCQYIEAFLKYLHKIGC